ncbi:MULTISPECIES: ABC transporter permease subunit [unclassified Bradyrhizobium]|uniref:ABC transporter permease subunit n=1 Tax=unclassified Bradyrhizobium TaxID=2631580 RepID=UPI002915DC06|nr:MULTISPECIES: ABC transporter permease subunit [unclassified Bradyrhizobium]
MTVWSIIYTYWPAFRQGLAVTFQLAFAAWMLGFVVGIPVGVVAHFDRVYFGILLRGLAFVLSSVPFLVLLYWLHFPFQSALNVVVPPFYTATFLLSLMNIVAIAEIWRGSLGNVRREYLLAAQVLGMPPLMRVFKIQVPLALREALPMLLATQVFILQSTLFASLISVDELFRVAQQINSTIYRPVEIYTGLALFFLAICLPLYSLAFYLRIRYLRDHSES